MLTPTLRRNSATLHIASPSIPRGNCGDDVLGCSSEFYTFRTKAQSVSLFNNTRCRRDNPIHPKVDLGLRDGAALRKSTDCSARRPKQNALRAFARRACCGSASAISVQLALRHRRLELRDLGGLGRLAVEGQHIALG